MIKTRSILAVAVASLAICAALVFPGFKPKIVRAQGFMTGLVCSSFNGGGCYGCGSGQTSSGAGWGCQSPNPPPGAMFGQCIKVPGGVGCRFINTYSDCGVYRPCYPNGPYTPGKCVSQPVCG